MSNKVHMSAISGKVYEMTSIAQFEQELAHLFYGKLPAIDDDEVVDITALYRTPEQVNTIIAKEDSGYHKILDNYIYYLHGPFSVLTGSGGIKHMYKRMLMEGMSEADILALVFVQMEDGKDYPITMLKIRSTDGRLRFI